SFQFAVSIARDCCIDRHRPGMKQIQRPDIQRASRKVHSRRRFGFDNHNHLYIRFCRKAAHPVTGRGKNLIKKAWLKKELEGNMERPIGIEPTPEPWQGSVLPLY